MRYGLRIIGNRLYKMRWHVNRIGKRAAIPQPTKERSATGAFGPAFSVCWRRGDSYSRLGAGKWGCGRQSDTLRAEESRAGSIGSSRWAKGGATRMFQGDRLVESTSA